ncbi:unnamed protein product [Prunus armeniaca]
MPANLLCTHYLFIPLQISHGPYFSLSFPKSSFNNANHLLLQQHILEILCNVLRHIPTLIQSNEVVDDSSTTSHLLPLLIQHFSDFFAKPSLKNLILKENDEFEKIKQTIDSVWEFHDIRSQSLLKIMTTKLEDTKGIVYMYFVLLKIVYRLGNSLRVEK